MILISQNMTFFKVLRWGKVIHEVRKIKNIFYKLFLGKNVHQLVGVQLLGELPYTLIN